MFQLLDSYTSGISIFCIEYIIPLATATAFSYHILSAIGVHETGGPVMGTAGASLLSTHCMYVWILPSQYDLLLQPCATR
jgi:hypothetical protein